MSRSGEDAGRGAALRARAEARLGAPPSPLPDTPDTPDMKSQGAADEPLLKTRLVHELQVHQIELAMQNEELIDARDQLEAALARYTELYEFAPVGYFTLDRDGVIRQVNLMGARLLGVERGRLLGRGLSRFLSDEGAFRGWLAQTFAAAPDQPTSELELTTRAAAPAAPSFVQLTGAATVKGDECRAILIDVSRQRRAEERLREAQKMEALGHLAGGVAHDFNNLLTVMLSHTDFALTSVPDDLELRQDLLDVKTAAQRAAALTRQLLTFASKQVSRPQMVDLNAVVRATMSLLRRTLGEHIDLVLDLAADLSPIAIDPVQLEQVIVNVAINARDAMPHGGRLTITTASEDHAGARVRLLLTDSGAGMNPTTRQHIFEPFFTTKGRAGGSGLGLSTVHGIMQQCGGEITVRSELGQGAAFAFHFPRATPPPAGASPVAHPAAARAARGETILIVDDDLAVRRAAARILAQSGYHLLEAGDGEEALRVSEQHAGPIALVLSDLLMPRMTGRELVARLKSARPETRVLFMSGYVGLDTEPGGPLEPAAPLLGKPFEPEALRSRVRELLDTAPATPAAQPAAGPGYSGLRS